MDKIHIYQAFISYRHIMPDMAIAQELHRQLESYAIPTALKKTLGVKKMGKVFRDQEELPTSSDLGHDIERALEDSAWLIVVCTPKLLESKWCMKEVDAFIAMGRRDRILTLLVQGEPEDSFPPKLRYSLVDGEMVEVEPLAADVRGATLKEMTKKLKVEKLRILAPILGVGFDDLKQREREHRLKNRAKIAAATSVLLALFGIYALNRNLVIAKERDESYRNEMFMLLEKSALATSQGDKLGAAVHAMDALEISSLIEHDQEEMIQTALESTMYALTGEQVSTIKNNNMTMTDLQFSPAGDRILATANMNTAVLIDPMNGEMLFSVNNNLEPLGSVEFSPDGRYFLTVCHWENSLSIWDSESGTLVDSYTMEQRESWLLGHAHFSFKPNEVLIKEENRLLLWNYSTGEIRILEENLATYSTRYAEGTMSADGRFFALACDLDGVIRLWDLKDNSMQILGKNNDFYSVPRFQADASHLAALSGSLVYVWDVKSDQLPWQFMMPDAEMATDVSISPTDHQLAVATLNGIHVLDMDTKEILWSLREEDSHQIFQGTFSPDGAYLLVEHEWIRLYDASSGVLLTDFNGLHGSDAVFQRDNGTVLISMQDGTFGAFTTPICATVQTWSSFTESLYTTPRFTPLQNDDMSLETWHSPGAPYENIPPQLFSSPNGKDLALAHSDGFVEIWDVEVSAQPLHGIAEHRMPVTDLLFFDRLVATASLDGRIMLFDLDVGAIQSVIPVGSPVHRLEFSVDGRKIMAYCPDIHTAYVYSTQKPVCLFALTGTSGPMADMGFTQDNTRSVLINKDGSAQVGTIYSQRDLLLDAILERMGSEEGR